LIVCYKKTNMLRVVYIPPEWMPRLRELADLHTEGELFRAPCGGPWTIGLLGYHVRKARRGKDWPWATVYGLRHLFATEALRRGVPVAHVSELLGHVDTKQVMKSYSHLARHDVELHASLAKVQGKPKKRKR
jgi:integrase